MPINSKYSNQQVEQVISDILAVLTRHEASIDLSLMCLGNATSHIIGHSVPQHQQHHVIETFNNALKATLKS